MQPDWHKGVDTVYLLTRRRKNFLNQNGAWDFYIHLHIHSSPSCRDSLVTNPLREAADFM